MQFTISTADNGLYRWVLRDGPSDVLMEAGYARTIDRCLTEIALSRSALNAQFHLDRDPRSFSPHPSLDRYATNPHPTGGHPLPLQQDIPAGPDQGQLSNSF